MLFIKYNQDDYKDVKSLYRLIKIGELEDIAAKTPTSDIDRNIKIYSALCNLDPENKLYKEKVSFFAVEQQKNLEREKQQKQKEFSELELLNWRWSKSYSYAIAEGQIKNISGKKMERVQALVTWYDKNDKMITSETNFTTYNPIMPGQITPFKVMTRHNPSMASATIEFKFLFGNKIRVYNKKN
jgi:hypothetical protein